MHEPLPNALLSGLPPAAEDETLPERPPVTYETARVGRGEVALQLLADVRATLDGMPLDKTRRMLSRKLESLRFAVERWGAIPPRSEQVSAMLEMLLKLQEAALEARALTE